MSLFRVAKQKFLINIYFTRETSGQNSSTMSIEWTQDEEELLIDFYGKHEGLHNKHHADYNYNRKNRLLTELVRDLNRISNSKKFKVDAVSMHWNELRNIYNQHKRQVSDGALQWCDRF